MPFDAERVVRSLDEIVEVAESVRLLPGGEALAVRLEAAAEVLLSAYIELEAANERHASDRATLRQRSGS